MTFLDIFSKNKIPELKKSIIVDNREMNSFVPAELRKLGFSLEFRQLPVADYLINNLAVERKTISDFKSSIVDRRIVSQLKELMQYPSHLLIIEGIGSEDIYFGQIHENAFRGMLLTIATEFKTPMIFAKNEKDTAQYLAILANKFKKSEFPLRASKILLTVEEQVQFILEGFPYVGPTTAKRLICEFKTLKNLANASKEELEKIVGKRAEKIYSLFNKK